ncbi:restriction endonuclease subunit R [Geothermobacter hydrogeniphilus]|uniref:Restriction endonuclease subunit R n=1 Tax=Geothermobacter hydrogeniphilus TaxID=1969733 RepID=A0A2K2H5K2_9BACT|nr:DEAD/DEAH box helicase family protein [Geothermobacter hydrogeniphilus]PNU18527.1 restriction endonuclease subunit R [Geothermobacter hydrogeniphilus]
MTSQNFEFLREGYSELADLGGFAETYLHSDPASAVAKMRLFAEQLVARIYQIHRLPRPYQANFLDLLNNGAFTSMVPQVILDKIHLLRKIGNKGVHGDPVSVSEAVSNLDECFDLARWFHVFIAQGDRDSLPVFRRIMAEPEDSKGKIKKEKKAALQKLKAQEERMQQLLAELEEQRAAVQVAEKRAEELAELLVSGQQVADALELDEEATRQRLIDVQLAEAGWKVGPKGASTAEVIQEEEVPYQPTDSGIGYADYVLREDNGKALAVIEAKRTSKNPEIGREQARLYADGIEKREGQRPVIFYTNGYQTWLWDDALNYPPRQVYGFYSRDSLQYLVQQRALRQSLSSRNPRSHITSRLYQIEAIKRICERFDQGYRKGLIVQATGTGKTRVAVALTDLLIQTGWVKRVLFLCDRRELRKQAKNAFDEFIDEPTTYVTARTARDRTQRVYFATYPAMQKIFTTFDVGFFDLIIADESHRSIYNRYRELFFHFDCLQVGLTATPVDFIARNTYALFGCEEKNPTAYYPLERAVEEGHLVPYEVYTHTTNFLRKGIKYSQLTEEQKRQLEEDGENPEDFDIDSRDVDRQIFNKETNRAILRNLMENGIREATGQHPGKSIIFARSHDHAVLLGKLFDEMYPQYGGAFCKVIDNYDPRAEQLIDDFKQTDGSKELTIAISVDMLDTGIDVPEVVNLVFAKPIRSKVKFWQMIGRGTRLCRDLFGPGKHKTKFRIFDHWGNFEYFEQNKPEAEPRPTKPLLQQIFEARLLLAETALAKAELDAFGIARELIAGDLAALPEKTIAVREKWKELARVSRPEVLDQFAPVTQVILRDEIAPLMQWVKLAGYVDAYQLDLLIAQLQVEKLRGSGRFDDLKDKLLDRVAKLQMHLNPVREKFDTIKRVKTPQFWDSADIAALEEVRRELRGIMHHREKETGPGRPEPKVIDISDGDIEFERRKTNIREVDMTVYKKQVEEALREHFDTSPTLQKIRNGQPVSEADLNSLASLILTQHPGIDITLLKEFYEEAQPLDFILRRIIGMEAEAVNRRFEHFVQKYPGLRANQVLFLNMLKNHISKHGAIELDRLYEPPFTHLASDGVDGIFNDEQQVDELLVILDTFKPEGVNTQA